MKWHTKIFFWFVALLPTQLAYHLWPDWASVLGRRSDYLSPTVYVTDLLLLVVLTLWVIGEPSLIKESLKRYWRWFALGILIALINLIFASSPRVAATKWLKVFELILLGYYVWRTKPRLSTVTFGLAIGMCYTSLLALGQFFRQRTIGGLFWYLGERTFTSATPGVALINLGSSLGLRLRAYATLPHPNVLGGFLGVSETLIFQQVLDTKVQPVKRMFYLCVLVIGLLGLLVSFSRSALLATSLALTLVYLSSRKPKRALTLVLVLFIALVVSSLLFTVGAQDESVVVRGQLLVAAVKLWFQSPIMGIGMGNFLVRLPEYLPTRQIYFLQPVHNIYLLLAAETGIAGLGIFLVGLWLTVRKLIRSGKSHVTTASAFAILLLVGLVDHYPLTLQAGQLLLALVWALVLT